MQKSGNHLAERRPPERFIDDLVARAGKKCPGVIRECPTGHKYELCRLIRHRPLQLVIQIHAGHFRHHEIAQDEIESLARTEPGKRFPGRCITKVTPLFLLPVAVELLEKCDEVVGLLLVFQACINHLRPRYLGFRVLDVFAEAGLVPGDAGVLVRGCI